jgi:hypothetical protein
LFPDYFHSLLVYRFASFFLYFLISLVLSLFPCFLHSFLRS